MPKLAPISWLQTQGTRPAVRAFSSLLSGQLLNAGAGLLIGKTIALFVPSAAFGAYNLGFALMTLGHTLLIAPVLQSLKAEQTRHGWAAVFPFYALVLMSFYCLAAVGAGVYGLLTDNLLIAALMLLAFVGQGFYAAGSEYLNLSGRYTAYATLQASYGAVNLLLLVGVVLGWGGATTTGLWMVLALLNTGFAGIAWMATRQVLPSPRNLPDNLPDYQLLRTNLRTYALPLVGLAVWSWLANYADRYIINYYLTEAAVGIYSAGYGLGSKMLLLVGPFMVHLSSRLYQLRADGGTGVAAWQLQRQYIGRYVVVGLGACGVFFLSRNLVGQLLLSDAYRAAFLIAPIIALGYLFLTLIHLHEIKWYVYGQTRYIFWHYCAGAVLNIGLNIVLIPIWGLVGAALATACSFLMQLGLVMYLYHRSL